MPVPNDEQHPAWRERSLTLPDTLCGPPDSANGGIVAGLLAAGLDGPVEVTLRRPVPLGETVRIERHGESAVLLRLGTEVLALAQRTGKPLDPPEPPSWEAALLATSQREPAEMHPFPTCFVCGPSRECGDGLCILPGPLGTPGAVAAPWIPQGRIADGNGRVRPEFLWAALDCPGGHAALAGRRPRPIVLGRIAADIRPGPALGEPCIVTGWRIASHDRRHVVGSALFAADGTCYGTARATWFEV